MTKLRRQLVNWLSIGSLVLKKRSLCRASFKQHFKLDPCLVEIVFNRLRKKYTSLSPNHLLWTLYFLKSKDPDTFKIASTLSTTPKTLDKYVEQYLKKILAISPKVVADMIILTIVNFLV
jgi:hypothetical protein